MLLSELYEHYGTWTKLVRELDLGNNTYQVWRKQGYIPFKAQLLIERKTKRLFKASEEHGKPEQKREGLSVSTHKEKYESTNSA